MTRRVLLTGSTGYLGRYLAAELQRQGLEVLRAGRHDGELPLDLSALGESSDRAELAEAAVDLVINCAAMARMGDCQARPTVALQVNGKAPGQLARALGCRFVQISTDLVFAGDRAPYAAADEPQPLSVYGMSKAAGERSVPADALVLRIPMLFGPSGDGRQGATDMLRRGVGSPDRLTLFTNEFRTPLHVADAAAGVVALARDESQTGVLHLAGTERVSRWEFAERFCAVAGLPLDSFDRGVSEDPRRPADVSLTPDWSPERGLDAALAAS